MFSAASGLKSSTSLHFTPLHAAMTLSLDRLKHYWLTGETALGFLAGYYTCAERLYRLTGVVGAGGQKAGPTSPPKDPSRYGIGKGILYVLNGIAADKMEAEALKFTWLF